MMLTRFLPATALGVALSACSQAPQAPAGAMAFPPAVVTVEPAALMPLEDTTEYVAQLRSLTSTAIQPQIDGQITGVFVTSGTRVRRGQRLFQIDPQRQQAAVSSQEAERAAREAEIVFARQQQQRAAALFAAGAISQAEAEQADTTLRSAEARLQALNAQVQQQQVQLRYFTVEAPTDGIVGDVIARVGNQVGPQTVLTTIDQNDVLELNVQVPIDRAGALKPGLEIRVVSGDGGEVVGTTTVGFISPRVDDSTQSVLVKGNVRNPDGALRAGQFVRARVVWSTGEGLVIPVTAALRINGAFFVFVAENGKGPDGSDAVIARQRPIKVGAITGDHYPVLEGLTVGDRVVTVGAQKLMDGAPIMPQAPGAAAAGSAPAGQAPAPDQK